MKHSPTLILAVVLLSLALLPSCSKSSANETAERPAVAVEMATVAPSDLEDTIEVVGTLTAKFEGEVKAEYSGIVTDVYVTEWVPVTKGTLLARFDRREPEAELKAATAARLQSEVAANRAQRELERSVKLKAAGLATQQNLDDARTAAEAADAQLGASKAQEEMSRTRLAKTAIVSPMDGVVAERTVNPGDFIENMGSPAPMFRIVDNRKLELTVSIPSSSIAAVTLGQPLRFSSDALAGRTFEGHVSFINPAADESSRTVRVIALVDNKDGALKTGLFVKGSIVTGERKGVLSIPRSALVTWDPATRAGVVFVVEGDRAKRKDVVTGTSAGQLIPVEQGVAAGDHVVTRGAFNLKDGDRVAVAKGTVAWMGAEPTEQIAGCHPDDRASAREEGSLRLVQMMFLPPAPAHVARLYQPARSLLASFVGMTARIGGAEQTCRAERSNGSLRLVQMRFLPPAPAHVARLYQPARSLLASLVGMTTRNGGATSTPHSLPLGA
jgi:RND family efflux transporter MFP subunit